MTDGSATNGPTTLLVQMPSWWPKGWPIRNAFILAGVLAFIAGCLIAYLLQPKPTQPIALPPERADTTATDTTGLAAGEDTATYEYLTDTTEAFDTSSASAALMAAPTTAAVVATPLAAAPAPRATRGRPFGPFGLYGNGDFVWGPDPFTGSIGGNQPSTVCVEIAEHRAKGMQIVLFLTGGTHEQYKTRGRFDMRKWQNRMDDYNRTTIKDCIAKGVSDGTINGNSMIDEPENSDWGGNITKPMLDYMAGYSHKYFPTLPAGINHGAGGYLWRRSERFKTVDFVNYQYRWDAARSQGKPEIYRDIVLKQSIADGVATSFSLQLINGGKPDRRDRRWDCRDSDQFGQGNRYPLCRMTPAQIKQFGTVLGTANSTASPVCGMFLWTFDRNYFNISAIKSAFGAVATATKAATDHVCRRPA